MPRSVGSALGQRLRHRHTTETEKISQPALVKKPHNFLQIVSGIVWGQCRPIRAVSLEETRREFWMALSSKPGLPLKRRLENYRAWTSGTNEDKQAAFIRPEKMTNEHGWRRPRADLLQSADVRICSTVVPILDHRHRNYVLFLASSGESYLSPDLTGNAPEKRLLGMLCCILLYRKKGSKYMPVYVRGTFLYYWPIL